MPATLLDVIYGDNGKQHHIWCNFAMRNGPCKQCDRLYKLYPYKPGDDPHKLVKTYFPNVIRVKE